MKIHIKFKVATDEQLEKARVLSHLKNNEFLLKVLTLFPDTIMLFQNNYCAQDHEGTLYTRLRLLYQV